MNLLYHIGYDMSIVIISDLFAVGYEDSPSLRKPKWKKKRRTMTGTLWFGTKYPMFTGRGSGKKTRNISRFYLGDVPVFADIEDVDSVHHLILDLREKARRESNSTTGSGPT
jgi:hypothetical protein